MFRGLKEVWRLALHCGVKFAIAVPESKRIMTGERWITDF